MPTVYRHTDSERIVFHFLGHDDILRFRFPTIGRASQAQRLSPNTVPSRGKPKRRRARPFFEIFGAARTATGRNPSTRSAGRHTLGRTEARVKGAILSTWGGCRLELKCSPHRLHKNRATATSNSSVWQRSGSCSSNVTAGYQPPALNLKPYICNTKLHI